MCTKTYIHSHTYMKMHVYTICTTHTHTHTAHPYTLYLYIMFMHVLYIVYTCTCTCMYCTVTLFIPNVRELVRKKAVMVMHRFFLLSPESVTHLEDDFRRSLSDRDPGVMEASLILFHDLIRSDTAKYKDLVDSFVMILQQVQCTMYTHTPIATMYSLLLTHSRTCTHTHTHTHAHAYIYTHTHTHSYAHAHTPTCTHMHTHI